MRITINALSTKTGGEIVHLNWLIYFQEMDDEVCIICSLHICM